MKTLQEEIGKQGEGLKDSRFFLLILLLSGTKYGEKGDGENPSLFEKVSAELAHAL